MSSIDSVILKDATEAVPLLPDLPECAEAPNGSLTASVPSGYRFWYDTVIDVMFQHPELSLAKIGEKCGRSGRWIYLLVKSDSFKEHYEERRREHNDRLSSAIITRASAVAVNALDRLLERLEENPASVSPKMALEVSASMAKILGFGAERAAAPTVNVQQTTVVAAASPSELQRARELIRQAEAARLAPKTLDLGPAEGRRSIDAAPAPEPSSEPG